MIKSRTIPGSTKPAELQIVSVDDPDYVMFCLRGEIPLREQILLLDRPHVCELISYLQSILETQ